MDEPLSERTVSNFSNGYNHAPSSPMRHRSSNNAVDMQPFEASWPQQTTQKKTQALFNEELEATDPATGMAFEQSKPGSQYLKQGEAIAAADGKFGKEDDADSLVSGHSASRLQKKANLEVVWQKANSINGIRKMNM